jgi:hypothetical protein
MNQDSTFSLLSKRLKNVVNQTEKLWLQRAIERATLTKKGAWVASAVHQQIYNLEQTSQLTDKTAAYKAVAELGGVSVADVKAVLAGDVTPVPPKVIEALATVLKMDKEFLLTLDKGDQQVLSKLEQPSQEGKSMAKSKKKNIVSTTDKITEDVKELPKEEDVKPVDAPAAKAADKPKVAVCSVMVSKEACGSAEEAAAMVSEAGYKADDMEEDDINYTFAQPGDYDMEAEGSMMDLGDGAVAKLMPVKAMPKDAEEPAKMEDEEKKALGDEMPDESMAAPESEDDAAELGVGKEMVAMMGKVLAELQTLTKLLSGKAGEPVAEPKKEEDEAAKSFDLLKRFNADIDTRLKSLGC